MPHPAPHLAKPPYDWGAVLALMQRSFATMDGRIDPPSSLSSLTTDALSRAEVWVVGPPPIACMVLTPHHGALYIGKLAVSPDHRHMGLARALIDTAADRARSLSLPCLTLQTRIELTENHATFRALGFVEVARTAHPGYARPTTLRFERPI